jgi:hypothetical protein
MPGIGPFEKRLEQLGRIVAFRRPRIIGMIVDGTKPPDEAAEAALLEPFDVQPEDTFVVVKKFCCVEGLPRVSCST